MGTFIDAKDYLLFARDTAVKGKSSILVYLIEMAIEQAEADAKKYEELPTNRFKRIAVHRAL